jgi:hypothetical protein
MIAKNKNNINPVLSDKFIMIKNIKREIINFAIEKSNLLRLISHSSLDK